MAPPGANAALFRVNPPPAGDATIRARIIDPNDRIRQSYKIAPLIVPRKEGRSS
jgi:hypothetical protein